MYRLPEEMTPLLPSDRGGSLAELAVVLHRESAVLSGLLRPATRSVVVDLLRQMNSYYSNLIEGHRTHPLDIERALRSDYSSEPAKRALQEESRAHIEVQRLLEARMANEPSLAICAPDFLRWIHREFYTRMPAEFLVVRDRKGNQRSFQPGEFRAFQVEVGRHVPPAHETIPQFLIRFAEAYDPGKLRGLHVIVAAAAAHHRLAWIHPFADGNGRVTRLFTHAYLIRAGLHSHGLWTMSRGLSRHRDEYMNALAAADEPRRSDLDGRGNLSEQGLRAFCKFFLETAIDQTRFMGELLNLDTLEARIVAYAQRRAFVKELPAESGFVLREVLLRGEVPRGEMARVTGTSERTARRILERLLEDGLVASNTPKGPVRLALPVKASGFYFPRLYPEGTDS